MQDAQNFGFFDHRPLPMRRTMGAAGPSNGAAHS
jgi:hypothetical protein